MALFVGPLGDCGFCHRRGETNEAYPSQCQQNTHTFTLENPTVADSLLLRANKVARVSPDAHVEIAFVSSAQAVPQWQRCKTTRTIKH